MVLFNTLSLYGMERAVVETLDLLRPEIEPHFLVSRTIQQRRLPLLDELRRRRLNYSFFSDEKGWPRIGRPRSSADIGSLAQAMVKGNLDVLAQARRSDILYVPSVAYLYFGLLAAPYYRIVGKPVVFHFHDLVVCFSLRLHWAAKLVTHFVHNTQLGRDKVLAANPAVARKPNRVLPCCTDMGQAPSQAAISLPADRRHLVFAGRASRAKGIDLLVEAFAQIAGQYGDVDLHVLGTEDEAELGSRLHEQTSKSPLAGRVHWWGYRQDVHAFLRRAYAYVQPSPPSLFLESFGRGVAEAMSLGIPTVCFASGALSELVLDGQTGLIAHEESAACLAEQLRRLLDDPGYRNDCGEQARHRYNALYADKPVRCQWLRFLDELP